MGRGGKGGLLTPLVVRGSSRSMREPNWPGWLLTESALREADMICVWVLLMLYGV